VIALTETWLSTGDDIKFFDLPGYICINNNRQYSRGGGVLMIILIIELLVN
jgi:hypothetical protein